MSDFSIIHTEIWSDPAFVELTPDARILFLWSWTNPAAAICGLYTVSARRMLAALGPGADAGRVEAALAELARKPLVLYDDEHEVLWVPARAQRSNRSPKAAAVMQKEVKRCPPSLLKRAFADRYPALAGGGAR